MANSFDLKNHLQDIYEAHISVGKLSSSAQIWDPKIVYMNTILQKNWSCIIKHSRKRDKD